MTTESVLHRSRRVVVVDDDPVTRMLICEALSMIGFAVEEAEDGNEALRLIEASPPDLVILDIDMPGLDGLQTCAAIRERDESSHLPVLIATSHSDSETITHSFAVGASEFIAKPIELQILQHRVHFLMRADATHQDLRRAHAEQRANERRQANAQRLAGLGHWDWTPSTQEMMWSDELFRILGIDPTQRPSYQSLIAAVHPDEQAAVENALRDSSTSGASWTLEHRVVTASGDVRFVRQQAEVLVDGSHSSQTVMGTVLDVTEHRQAQEQLRYLAYYDSLTGLPNRKMLDEFLERLLHRVDRGGGKVAALNIGLDRFARINDTLGIQTGNDLLKAVSSRLSECVRSTDYVSHGAEASSTLSRLEGDEFTLVLSGIRSADEASPLARRIIEALEEPFAVGHQILSISASIGIAITPDDGTRAETLLGNAGSALRCAQEQGGGEFRFFSPAMNARAVRRLAVENGLRLAMDRNELTLHYQPQWDGNSGEMIGAEALLRWPSGEFGMVSPVEFIPIAEESGLIVELGEWVLDRTCRQIVAWQEAGLDPVRVAVNVSSSQLQHPGLVGVMRGLLNRYGVDAALIEIEITETALMGDDPRTAATVVAIKELGVTLTLDDFGTGFSSLSHLSRFPIDVIKIDQSFVSAIESDTQSCAIIAAIIAMANRLWLRVVAEGVETESQEQFLRTEGCDIFQGYRFGRPVEVAEFSELLRKRAGRGE